MAAAGDAMQARGRPMRGADRRLVVGLGLTQTVGYGVLYYAFSVFLAPMARDLHASSAAITLAFTLAVLVSAVAAMPVGRYLDSRGGRGLMTGGSVLGTLCVIAWAQVSDVGELYGVFILVGLASAAVFYEAAFAVLIAASLPALRNQSILAITVVAGFASSIFLPLCGVLTVALGWRHALMILAGILAVTVPIHAVVVPPGSRLGHPATGARVTRDRRERIHLARRDPGFWLLTVGFVAQGAATATMGVHAVTYLTVLGHSAPFSAGIAGVLGVLSVLGRLITSSLSRRHAAATVTAAVFALQAVAIAVLPAVGRSVAGAVVCLGLFGLGFGVATVARPVLLAERYGTLGYASIAGTLTLPTTVAKAVGPLAAAAAVNRTGGYPPVITAVVIACGVGALGLRLSTRFAVPRASATQQPGMPRRSGGPAF